MILGDRHNIFNIFRKPVFDQTNNYYVLKMEQSLDKMLKMLCLSPELEEAHL